MNFYFILLFEFLILGDWGWGLGAWGLGIGPNPQSPIPNPQAPNPQPQKIINYKLKKFIIKFKKKKEI